MLPVPFQDHVGGVFLPVTDVSEPCEAGGIGSIHFLQPQLGRSFKLFSTLPGAEAGASVGAPGLRILTLMEP